MNAVHRRRFVGDSSAIRRRHRESATPDSRILPHQRQEHDVASNRCDA